MISCVTDTLPAVKRGMFRDFQNMLLDEGVWDDNALNKSDLIYTVKPGVCIEFFGCDNASKVHGPARDILFINEAQRVPREIFRQLDVRTTLKVIIDFNPVRRFWGETDFTGDKYVTIHSTYKDNPYLSKQQIEAIERNAKDANWWRVYGEGLTGGLEGLVYPQIETIDALPEDLSGEDVKFVTGLDFGFQNDPTAIVKIYMRGMNLYIDEVCYETKMLNRTIAERLKDEGLHRTMTICDNAEQKSIIELRGLGCNTFPCIKGKGSIKAGIQQVKQFNIFVTKRSTNVLDEADNYTYVKDNLTDTYTNEPIDAYNHAWDAIRYGVDYLIRKYRPKYARND
jgi:phage terminase large subunit